MTEQLNEIFVFLKNYLNSLKIDKLDIVCENSSIIIFAGKKDIGSSIRIYESKSSSNYIYCVGFYFYTSPN